MNAKLYDPNGRDIVESLGPFYAAHVNSMTAEGLHDKGDIAAELAYRDGEIQLLRADLAAANKRVAELEAQLAAPFTEQSLRERNGGYLPCPTGVVFVSETWLAEVKKDAARYRWLFTSDSQSGVMSRCNQVYRAWDGCSDWSDALDTAMSGQPASKGDGL